MAKYNTNSNAAASNCLLQLPARTYHMMIRFDRTTTELKFDFDGNALPRARCIPHPEHLLPHLLPRWRHPHPSVFVRYHGKALHEKTPFLRANGAMSKRAYHAIQNMSIFHAVMILMRSTPKVEYAPMYSGAANFSTALACGTRLTSPEQQHPMVWLLRQERHYAC